MSKIDESIISKNDDGIEEVYKRYLSKKEELGMKSTGKGIMDLIREDAVLSRKVNFEEAVLMNPSILANVENGEEILEQIQAKNSQTNVDEMDDGLDEAFRAYLQTITGIEEDNKSVGKCKSLNKTM